VKKARDKIVTLGSGCTNEDDDVDDSEGLYDDK